MLASARNTRSETNYSGSGRPLNGPPTTLLRVLYPLTVLNLAAMYDCEPEYSMNSFLCIQCNKKCMSVVTVRLLNKLLKLKAPFEVDMAISKSSLMGFYLNTKGFLSYPTQVCPLYRYL